MVRHFGPVSTASVLYLQSPQIPIAFRRPFNYIIPLALTSTLTANYPFHSGFPIISLCTSFLCTSVSGSPHLSLLSFHFSLCMFLSFSFSCCVVGDGCFSWQVSRWFCPCDAAHFPLCLSLPLLSLTVYSWLCVLSSLKALLSRRRCTRRYSISPSLHHSIWMCDRWSLCACGLSYLQPISFVYFAAKCVLYALLSV